MPQPDFRVGDIMRGSNFDYACAEFWVNGFVRHYFNFNFFNLRRLVGRDGIVYRFNF